MDIQGDCMNWVAVISNCPDLSDRIVKNIANDFEHFPGFDTGERISRKNGSPASHQVDCPIGWYAKEFPVLICCVTSGALIIFCGARNKDR